MNWLPVYSSVAGSLPVRDILDFTFNKRLGENARKVGFVRCRINVTSAGLVGLAINDVKGLQMWVDGRPVDARDRQELQMSVGEHRVTFSVDLPVQREPLRVELFDPAGSKSQAQFVAGK